MRLPSFVLISLLVLPSCGDDDTGPSPDASADAAMVSDAAIPPDAAMIHERVFGVTVTDPWVATSPDCELNQKLDGLVGAGGRKPTARVVFDEGIAAAEYVDLVTNIAPHAAVMGELLDSFYVPTLDVAAYQARACEYRATLGHLVDLWEVGNEVNGEWLGSGVIEKLVAATGVLRADATTFAALCPDADLQPEEKPIRIALTLYYNGPYDNGQPTASNCWEQAANAMERWVDVELGTPGALGAQEIAPYLDTLLVSYYEDDCDGIQPDWPAVFDHLGTVFPAAWLGFGECGTTNAAAKATYVERYYQGMDLPTYPNLHVSHPRFVGGYFWWYFSEDLADPAVYGALVAALASPFWSAP